MFPHKAPACTRCLVILENSFVIITMDDVHVRGCRAKPQKSSTKSLPSLKIKSEKISKYFALLFLNLIISALVKTGGACVWDTRAVALLQQARVEACTPASILFLTMQNIYELLCMIVEGVKEATNEEIPRVTHSNRRTCTTCIPTATTVGQAFRKIRLFLPIALLKGLI